MGTIRSFLDNMDWIGLMFLVMAALASLICLTVHELCHGLIAYRLGDPTAKLNGRLTLNPIAHIDFVGLFLMLTARVGWAKPVPVDMRNFRNPKRDMALTALAGPVSNFILAFSATAVCSVLVHFGWASGSWIQAAVLLFFCYLAVLSIGLGVFNLIPIPPLDGSKALFSLLPDRIYLTILKYERFVIVAVVLLAWSGTFSGPMNAAMQLIMWGMCTLTGFPFEIPMYYFF